jgi:hypothetical protein
LAYRAEALRDHLLELEGRSTGRVSTVERVRTALIDRARRCSRRGRTWRGRAPWRLTGRRRWSPSGLSVGRTAWGSRRRGPGEARPRRGRGRPKGGPSRPRS